MSKEKKKGGFGKFLAGAAIGAGVALLFAPQEGAKTRKQLKEKIDELIDKAKNLNMADVKESIEKKIDEIKTELADLDGEKVVAIAKQKAKQIQKKADELVRLAIEKGTPILERAANDVRLKTIEVLEITIAKLEKDEDKPAKATKTVKKTTKK